MSDSTETMSVEVAAVSKAPPTEPVSIGEYSIQGTLGQGAMGKVYLAVHNKLKRKVALKVLPHDFNDNPRRVERFAREMAAVGRLDHINVVRASDAGEHNGCHFIAMEYVEGMDLSNLCDEVGQLDVGVACELIRQAAIGLQHVDENDLVHRDIKPSNLMVTNRGIVKILDLGIARLKSTEELGTLTGDGAMMGTPDYMSPEQITDNRSVDIRSDIYSLGCTLYRLLAGRGPYSGPGYETKISKVVGHTQGAARPLSECVPGLPTEVSDIVQQMMSLDRDDRIQTPAEVVEALSSWSDSEAAHLVVANLVKDMQPKIGKADLAVPKKSPSAPNSHLWTRNTAIVLGALVTISVAYYVGHSLSLDKNVQRIAKTTDASAVRTLEIGSRVRNIDENTSHIGEQLDDISSSVNELNRNLTMNGHRPRKVRPSNVVGFNIAWTANSPPELYDQMIENNSNGVILQEPNPIKKGDGLTLFRMAIGGNTQFEVAGVDQESFEAAQADGDYIECRFTTSADLAHPLFLKSARQGRGNRHHWIGVTIWDGTDTYVNSYVTRRAGGNNSGDTITIDNKYPLVPGKTYSVRFHFWGAGKSDVFMVDDFTLNFELDKGKKRSN